jgi:voltage-gated potassium channel Kch
MKEILKKRRLNNKMKSLANHYIICGAGETGANVIYQFEKKQVPYIVIDNNRDRVDELLERGITSPPSRSFVSYRPARSSPAGCLELIEAPAGVIPRTRRRVPPR